jgi:hypothetical protein
MAEPEQQSGRRRRRGLEEVREAELSTCGELGRLFHCGREFFVEAFDAGKIAGQWRRTGKRPRRLLVTADARRYYYEQYPLSGAVVGGQGSVVSEGQGKGPGTSTSTSLALNRARMRRFRARCALGDAVASGN